MRTSNDTYNEAMAREAQARADMAEREAAKRRNEDFVRQSRPGSYLTTESAEAEDKRLAADGWRRGAFGTLSRDTGTGTESLSYGMDGTARYSYYPAAQPVSPPGSGRAGAAPQRPSADGNAQMESSMYDQMREVEGRVVAAGEERDQLLNDGLVAAMRFAADTENSGRLPQSACKLLTRQFGMDGVKSGILDAGYVPEDMTVNINGQPTKVKKGSFGITLAGRDKDGNVTYNPMFLSPTDVYAVMNANRSQFSDEQIAARRDALLQSGYSEKELSALVDMNFSMNRARGRAAQMRRTAQENEFNRRMKMQKLEIARMEEEGRDRRHLLGLIASADSAKKNGMSENDFVASLLRNKDTLDALMRSDQPIYEDEDGNEVSDPFEEKNGQRVLRKGVNIRRDDSGNEMYKQLSPEQAAQRARDLFVRADDGGRGAADAVWSAYSRLAGLPQGAMPRPEPAAEAQGAQGGYDPALVASDGTIGPTAMAAQENLGAGGQPPAQDGAALLQQMRGGGQPPAQGATQPAQGGAATQPAQTQAQAEKRKSLEAERKALLEADRKAQEQMTLDDADVADAQAQTDALWKEANAAQKAKQNTPERELAKIMEDERRDRNREAIYARQSARAEQTQMSDPRYLRSNLSFQSMPSNGSGDAQDAPRIDSQRMKDVRLRRAEADAADRVRAESFNESNERLMSRLGESQKAREAEWKERKRKIAEIEDAKERKRIRAEADKVLKLYSSGDTDAIRRYEAEVNALDALIEDATRD